MEDLQPALVLEMPFLLEVQLLEQELLMLNLTVAQLPQQVLEMLKQEEHHSVLLMHCYLKATLYLETS